jgi:20S proteasome alpha/beta subunit
MRHTLSNPSRRFSFGWPCPKRHIFRRVPIKSKPVTLIIGIICKDGIVLAADSQTTKSDAKVLGTNKITAVGTADGEFLIAESGSADLSNRAIEIINRKSDSLLLQDVEAIPRMVRESMREVTQELTSTLCLNPNSPDLERQEFLLAETNYYELMVAFYFCKEPHLFLLRSGFGPPIRAKSHFLTSGIGGDLADFILKAYTEPEMDTDFASVIAVKTVQDVSENIEGCGGPIRLTSIHTMPRRSRGGYVALSSSMTDDKISEISGTIKSIDKKIKAAQQNKIIAELKRQMQSELKKVRAINQRHLAEAEAEMKRRGLPIPPE